MQYAFICYDAVTVPENSPPKELNMRQLLIIDPQNDFCDSPGAALPVAGAVADLQRLAGFIDGTPLDGITVTLDSHPSVAVERTSFWCAADGSDVAPFTFITTQDVQNGVYLPKSQALTERVLAMLAQLAARERAGLVVWPIHCVTGTWGHNIQPDLMQQLNVWESMKQRAVRKVLKGEYFLTEHFGVFEADAPDASVPSTLFNSALANDLLSGTTTLFIAGQASSHCVAASFDQLVGYIREKNMAMPRMVLLKDCMSPVTGFEADAAAFFDRATAVGAELLTAQEAARVFA
jgi:nicotinamidase/pyrazinamidase